MSVWKPTEGTWSWRHPAAEARFWEKVSPRPCCPGESSTCQQVYHPCSWPMRADQQGVLSPCIRKTKESSDLIPNYPCIKTFPFILNMDSKSLSSITVMKRPQPHHTPLGRPAPLVFSGSGLLPASQIFLSSLNSFISHPLFVFWTQSL